MTDTATDNPLRQIATDEQWKAYDAVLIHGTNRKAAEAIGKNESTVRRNIATLLRRAAQQGYAPDHDLTHVVPDGLTLAGTSIRYGKDGAIESYWNKTRLAGREVGDTTTLPDPKKITKVSTLFDQQGKVTQQWVAERPEDFVRESLWQECAKAMASELPRELPAVAPEATTADLLAVYPVGDHHLGMLSWDQETGANYDLSIGERALMNATDFLVDGSFACDNALIPFLGDFMHYDSFETVTPTSRNMLDADGRYPKMVRAAIRAMRYLINAALRKHKHVTVIIEIGNHDLSSSIFLMECLANIYENEPRITVDTSPAHFHYYEFGKNLIGTHHGHGVKMDALPLVMAHDRAEAWGRTAHRLWLTGHIHHKTVHDYPGCTVESFRILAPADAWASQRGYRSARDMKSIFFHREFGEVGRATVSADMCVPVQ